MNILNKLEDCSVIIASAFGLSQIETLLGIIILAFQLVIIIYKLVLKLIEHIRKGNYQEVVDELEKAKQEIEKLKGENNGKK